MIITILIAVIIVPRNYHNGSYSFWSNSQFAFIHCGCYDNDWSLWISH